MVPSCWASFHGQRLGVVLKLCPPPQPPDPHSPSILPSYIWSEDQHSFSEWFPSPTVAVPQILFVSPLVSELTSSGQISAQECHSCLARGGKSLYQQSRFSARAFVSWSSLEHPTPHLAHPVTSQRAFLPSSLLPAAPDPPPRWTLQSERGPHR